MDVAKKSHEPAMPARIGESKMAGPTGLEPATSDVTGRRSNQLNYDPAVISTLWICSPAVSPALRLDCVTSILLGLLPAPLLSNHWALLERLTRSWRSALVGGGGFEPTTPCV
jgi:hypothetical protein